jgi:transcriptional regulator with XRE-family HTH domain
MEDPQSAGMADDTPEARFGVELRRLRIQAGLSVRRLAQELHRAHSTISDFENGRRLPSVEVVEQYEDYFGLPRGTLVAQRERARVQRLERPKTQPSMSSSTLSPAPTRVCARLNTKTQRCSLVARRKPKRC